MNFMRQERSRVVPVNSPVHNPRDVNRAVDMCIGAERTKAIAGRASF